MKKTLLLAAIGALAAGLIIAAAGQATQPWNPVVITNFESKGEVGWLGYGDLDGDGDYDLVTVVEAEQDNDSRLSWIRNDEIVLPGTTP